MLRSIKISSARRKPGAQVHEMTEYTPSQRQSYTLVTQLAIHRIIWHPWINQMNPSFLKNFNTSFFLVWFEIAVRLPFKRFFRNYWKLFSPHSLLHPSIWCSGPSATFKEGNALPSMPRLPHSTLLALVLFCIQLLLPYFLYAVHCESDTGCYMRCTEMLYY